MNILGHKIDVHNVYNYYYFCVAGAMRLPNLPCDKNKTHYLTDYYASEEFKLKLGPFNNYDDNTWLKFYDQEKIRTSGRLYVHN